ncbi:hypothetical protein AZI86_00445 [Bdellovibrio bacteriovorus]|uniref:Uncharacterized protein n=1 Tax=Bdellovibrio bacteriovorus TaxID=959 RepID=A0A150WMI5_BDEBC|nr:hypothetical protein [Bdellovibrio bacteriovorus]KYG65584.1 hypothetical protein AZI86_00445 [Bdellovibrio bacteriovorus]
MTSTILTNFELHQIERKIEEIFAVLDDLDPEVLEHADKLARHHEILDHYESLLKLSYKKARITESGLKLV